MRILAAGANSDSFGIFANGDAKSFLYFSPRVNYIIDPSWTVFGVMEAATETKRAAGLDNFVAAQATNIGVAPPPGFPGGIFFGRARFPGSHAYCAIYRRKPSFRHRLYSLQSIENIQNFGEEFMFHRQLGLGLLVCLFSVYFPADVHARATGLTVSEVLPLTPSLSTASGTIHSRVLNRMDTIQWEPGSDKQTAVLTQGGRILNLDEWFKIRASSVDYSEDGSAMMASVIINLAAKLLYIPLLDQSKAPVVIPETRRHFGAPRLSPDANHYALIEVPKRADRAVVGDALWVMQLSDYIADANKGAAQPTSAYMHCVHSATAASAGALPDRVVATAWSPNGDRLAYAVNSFGVSGTPSTVTVKVFDVATKSSKDILSVADVGHMEWAENDSVFLLSEKTLPSSGRPAYQISRLDLSKNKVEDLGLGDVLLETFHASSDGKWITFAPLADIPGPLTSSASNAILYKVATKEQYQLTGVSSACFTADNLQMILHRTQNSASAPERPYWTADIGDLVAAESSGSVDVASLTSKLTAAGQPVLAYEPPQDPANFDKFMELKEYGVSVKNSFKVLVRFENKSENYFNFALNNKDPFKCTLFDALGAKIATSSGSSSGPRTKVTFGPGDYIYFDCHGSRPLSYRPGTKARLVVEVDGYESAGRMERHLILP